MIRSNFAATFAAAGSAGSSIRLPFSAASEMVKSGWRNSWLSALAMPPSSISRALWRIRDWNALAVRSRIRQP